MKTLTVVYVTSRPEPELGWFFDSLNPQINDWDRVDVIVVDSFFSGIPDERHIKGTGSIIYTKPKPTIWQGEHRITSQDWWAVSNARNTGIALCQTEWIAFCDDRCVLMPTWLQSIRTAMEVNYAVCGSYEKRHGMVVQNGVITHGGTVVGSDNRDTGRDLYAIECDGGSWYGCTNALPLEWALNVNGYSEDICDGLSFEDIPFGMTLKNFGYSIRFDKAMKMIEDRTPEKTGSVMKRSDFGVSPNDKSHRVLEIFRSEKTSLNTYSLRDLRQSMLSGAQWPAPTAAHNEWFTGTPLADL